MKMPKEKVQKKKLKLIKEAFEYHEFQVKDYCDLIDYEMINLIDKQVNNEKCKSIDVFALYIHTHEIADRILCKKLVKI